MVRTFLLLWLVVHWLSFRGIEGDYQVLVSVHSLVLLESRCAECYGEGGGSIQRDSCCDGNNTSSCPDSCDILLRFCHLGDVSQSNLTNRSVFGTNCAQNSLSNYFEDFLGYNLKAGETYPDYDAGSSDLQGGIVFRTSVAYNGTGQWKGAQLVIPVVDRDSADFDDLIDYFIIPINISAGDVLTNNFRGRYNYTQLELTIEVKCTTLNKRDENCVCLPGFTGPLCEDVCTGVICNNGELTTDTVEVTTSSSTSSHSPAAALPVVAITVGVVGGVLFSLILVILVLILALLVFKRSRTQSFVIQESTTSNFDSSRKVVLRSGDVHIYDEAAGNGANKTGTSGSEILKEFNNPIYGDDPELEHKYETTDELHSGSKDHSDQYQELERKFENPIYGDEDDDNLNDPIPAHESNIDYDQVGNVYHTLESEQDRKQRYAAAAGGQAAAAVAASVELKDSSKGKTGKPQHSYEDVQ